MKVFYLNLNKYMQSKKFNVLEKDILKDCLEYFTQDDIHIMTEDSPDVIDAFNYIRADERLSKNFDKLVDLGFYNFASNIVRAYILSKYDEMLYLDFDTMLRYYSLDIVREHPDKLLLDTYEYNGGVSAQLNVVYTGHGHSDFFKALLDVYRELNINTLRDAYDEDVILATQAKSGIYLKLEDRIMCSHLCIGKNFATENIRVVITDLTMAETLKRCKLKDNEGLIIITCGIYDPSFVWPTRPFKYFAFEIPVNFYKDHFKEALLWQVSNKIIDNTTYLPEGCVEVKNIYLGDIDE